MEILDLIKELKISWSKVSLPTKALYAVLTFIASANIASLFSDAVITWHGVFLDGIEFYRSYVRVALEWVAVPFNLHFKSWQLDVICLSMIFIGGIFRAKKSVKYRVNIVKQQILNGGAMTKFSAIFSIFLLPVFMLAIYEFMGPYSSEQGVTIALAFLAGYCVVIGLFTWQKKCLNLRAHLKIQNLNKLCKNFKANFLHRRTLVLSQRIYTMN